MPAESFETLYRGVLPGCTSASVLADVSLAGVRYSAAPRLLAAAKIARNADGNSTQPVSIFARLI